MHRTATTRQQAWWVTAALGAGVIAVCYGFARYAYGLFVPQIGDAFDLTGTGLGILGGVATVGYTVGLLSAPAAAAHSARATTIGAGVLATVGLLTVSLAPSAPLLGIGLVVAGSGAGLISPGVAQLISQTIRPAAKPRAQTWANTGTSLGLAASAFTPALLIGWRHTWVMFGVVAAAITLLAARMLPRPAGRLPSTRPAGGRLWRPGAGSLLTNSVLLGLTSAPYWTFSRQRVLEAELSVTLTTWFWFTIGLAGLAGGIAGQLTQRYGLVRTNVATWSLWAIGMTLLGLPVLGPATVLLSAALFGACYMALSGMCILWAQQLYPEASARGVTFSFLGLGAGQMLGAPLAGGAADRPGLAAVFAITAIVSLTAWYQIFPRFAAPEPAVRHLDRPVRRQRRAGPSR